MKTRIALDMLPQPDDSTCGPTCLHAVYRYFGDDINLTRVISEMHYLEEGGTLAVQLACHALERGYRAKIFTYNLQIFDPTWFEPGAPDIKERLKNQMKHKKGGKLSTATRSYLRFLKLGGILKFEDLTTGLIRKYLNRQIPILTGLSATFLYRSAREFGADSEYDDIRGEPAGHFVVLCGYDRNERNVLVADPYIQNPVSGSSLYEVNIDRLVCSILLGIITYDANFLIIQPKEPLTGVNVGKPGRSK